MSSETNSKIQYLESVVGSMGNVPSLEGVGGSIDVSQFTGIISKLESELKFKANKTDLDSFRDALDLKADKTHVNKEIKRIDALIEELRQKMSEIEDKNIAMGKKVENLA